MIPVKKFSKDNYSSAIILSIKGIFCANVMIKVLLINVEASGDTQVALQLLLFLPTLIPEIGQQDDAYNVVI